VYCFNCRDRENQEVDYFTETYNGKAERQPEAKCHYYPQVTMLMIALAAGRGWRGGAELERPSCVWAPMRT
jgi:hypothetical protein